MNHPIEKILNKLETQIKGSFFVSLETESIEIKPVPPTSGAWDEICKSVNAFLNTDGGVIVLGIKEEGKDHVTKKYSFTGYREEAENKLKDIKIRFTDERSRALDFNDWDEFLRFEIRDFFSGKIALIFVSPLPGDRKPVFFQGKAYKRRLTGDHLLTQSEISEILAFREDASLSRELQQIPNTSVDDLSIDALNEYIQNLNRQFKVETIKADIHGAIPFLERKGFIRESVVTYLGMLVCGLHPSDKIGFRCHVQGFVDVPNKIAQDKQDIIGNILPIMESSFSYILRNIQVGVSSEMGGSSVPQYPEDVLRETINNALAHRDYTVNKQVIIAIKPGQNISISNPGSFSKHFVIEHPDHEIPVRRLIPEARPRNPKLADVLRVYRKWEGRGIGMATLVSLSLEDKIDIPTYRLHSQEVKLFLNAGRLVDDNIESRFRAFDEYIEKKIGGRPLNFSEKAVLAYLMKSEWKNQHYHFTIMLTPDNNHFEALVELERAKLVYKHPSSDNLYPIFIVDRMLMRQDFHFEMTKIFGESYSGLDYSLREILECLYRQSQFSKNKTGSAKSVAFALWNEKHGANQDIKKFDTFYRQIRYYFNKLERTDFIRRIEGVKGFSLNLDFLKNRLF